MLEWTTGSFLPVRAVLSTQRAGYGCLYSTIMREEGTIVEECEFVILHSQPAEHPYQKVSSWSSGGLLRV